MADDDLSSPLLQSPRADQSHVIIAVQDDDSGSDPSDQDQHTRRNQTRHNFLIGNNHKDGSICWAGSSRNPYEFVGSDGLSVPGTTTADPFRNDTPGVTGVYEIVKIVVCVPIALARLVLFALCLLVGYIATKLALGGWKDNQNPMPRWRCRIMWITRLSSRCILFSFGYHWIRRKGKPAPREIAPIVVSNHISYIEPIFYFYELSPTIVASESHDSLPFVGTIIRAMQVIYVNRFSQSSRKNAVSEIKTVVVGLDLGHTRVDRFRGFHTRPAVKLGSMLFAPYLGMCDGRCSRSTLRRRSFVGDQGPGAIGSIEPDLSRSGAALFGCCWPSLFFDGMDWKSANIYGSRDVEPIRAACRCHCRRSTGQQSEDKRRP